MISLRVVVRNTKVYKICKFYRLNFFMEVPRPNFFLLKGEKWWKLQIIKRVGEKEVLYSNFSSRAGFPLYLPWLFSSGLSGKFQTTIYFASQKKTPREI